MIDRTLWRCGLVWRNRRIITAVIASASLLGAIPGAAQLLPSVATPLAIEIRSERVTAFDVRDPSRRQFGLLEFRGGLVLRSPHRGFDGISAIRVAADGAHFIALSDKGSWFRGRLLYEGTRPSGIADAEMAPMLGANGKPRFNYGKEGLLARGRPIELPSALRSLPANRGLEALVFVPRGLALAGTLIAISERGLDEAGNISGFLIGGPTPGSFAVKRNSNYDITDAALLPGGDVLLLERRFGWDSGLAVRLRRIALGDIKPGALVDGPILFDADLGYEIDNMEGLSVHRSAGGETVLTLISDDNFSTVQRTLLLQFMLAEP